MNSEAIFWIVYIAGIILSAGVLGFLDIVGPNDIVAAWTMCLIWPIFIFAAIICAICYGPFWIGNKLRNIIR